MKKIAFMICLLIPMLGFSQTSYPKTTVIEGDTIIMITSDQLVNINVKLIERKELLDIVQIKDETISKQNDVISALELNIEDYKLLISLKDSINTELTDQNQILTDQLEEERENVKKLKFTRKLLTFVGLGVGAGGGILLGRALK